MIVVSGGSGDLAGRTLTRLVELVGPDKVRTVSRTPEKVTGVPAVYGDFADPASLGPAFQGAQRLLLVSIGGMDPEDEGRQTNAVEAAVKAGVEHIVYTSIPKATDPGNPVPLAKYHGATERLIAETGVPFTMLRFNIWPDVLDHLGIVPNAIEHGRLVSNAGQGRVGYITKDDSAAVAAAVLANGSHQGETLEVTGPQALTDEEFAAVLSEVGGRPVEYVPVADDELAAQLTEMGISASFADAWARAGIQRRGGWWDLRTDVVEQATGRPPTSLLAHFVSRE
jgi:NAD(P)H dehydrogenase (quinone)